MLVTGISNARVQFGKKVVFQDLSLGIEPAQCIAVLGRNGVGKSTLFRMLLGIVRLEVGAVSVVGIDSQRNGALARRQIGYSPDSPSFPFGISPSQIFKLMQPLYPNWDDSIVKQLMHDCKLPYDGPIGRFSKGMQMQVSLIAAIARRPALLLLDEPFGCLDPVARARWSEYIKEHLNSGNSSLLYSTHSIEDINSGFCDRLLMIENKGLAFDHKYGSSPPNYLKVSSRNCDRILGEFPSLEVVLVRSDVTVITDGLQKIELVKEWASRNKLLVSSISIPMVLALCGTNDFDEQE